MVVFSGCFERPWAVVLGLGAEVPEHLRASLAPVRPGPRVYPRVRLQLMLLHELLATFSTLKGLLARVDALVDRPFLIGDKALLAEATRVALVPVVGTLVDVTDVTPGKRLTTDRAQERPRKRIHCTGLMSFSFLPTKYQSCCSSSTEA